MTCPDCRVELRHQEGCLVCPICGDNKCQPEGAGVSAGVAPRGAGDGAPRLAEGAGEGVPEQRPVREEPSGRVAGPVGRYARFIGCIVQVVWFDAYEERATELGMAELEDRARKYAMQTTYGQLIGLGEDGMGLTLTRSSGTDSTYAYIPYGLVVEVKQMGPIA